MNGRDRPDQAPARASTPATDDNERYRSLLTHNPHPVFSLDLHGFFRDANPAAERLSGFPLADLRRINCLDLVTAADRGVVAEAFDRVRAGIPVELEAAITDRDGQVLELRLVGVPVVVDGEVLGIHGVAEDVTERNRMADELVLARRVAEEASAAKSLLLANVSHELRTPLTTMLATAELLEDSELGPDQLRFLQAMQRAGRRLGQLIDDILDLSRIEARRVQLRPEPFELRTLLADLTDWAIERAGAKGLRFGITVDPELPLVVVGDQLRIGQVVTNLVDNAIKFTAVGYVDLAVRWEGHVDDRAWVHVEVKDSGIGIPDDRRHDIFEPFAQADPSLTRRHEGAGLGLAICSQLVRLMGGEVRLESAAGVGTTVLVDLPLQTVDAGSPCRERASSAARSR